MDLETLRSEWDRRVLTDPALDKSGCEALRIRQRLEGATFAGRPLCGVLRPEFVDPDGLARMRQVCSVLSSAIRKVRQDLTSGERWWEELDLRPGVEELVRMEPGYDRLGITVRLDAFEVGGELSFLELNAEAPAGIAYHDVLVKLFEGLDAMQALRERFRVRPLRVVGHLLQALLTTWNEWGRGAGKPRIAIVDWRDSPTQPEFRLLADAFTRVGYRTVVADPRELEMSRGRLFAAGERIDLLYRRVLVLDCLERKDEVGALLEAVRQRAICMVNPFRAAILHRKQLFALLTDPAEDFGLSSEERRTIDLHIPWTRVLSAVRSMGPEGKEVDLLDYVRRNREELVIKPDDEYGGHGVVLGWRCDEADWEKAISRGLQGVSSVVQRRVPLEWRPFPLMDGSRTSASFLMDCDPYVFRGRMGGFLTRLTGGELANVSAGGGMIPTFVVEPL